MSQFFTAVIIARIPLFLFQAVQAALLPKLSALASAGRFDEFRIGFRKLVAVVAGVGAVAVRRRVRDRPVGHPVAVRTGVRSRAPNRRPARGRQRAVHARPGDGPSRDRSRWPHEDGAVLAGRA